MTLNTSRNLLALAILSATVAAPVSAETMEEVVVTADFRQTDVQSIPEATSVVGAAAIEERSAEHLESILALAPNVNFSSGASRGRYFQIRGIGERSQFVDPVNPSVGLRIDGIDMTGLGGAGNLFDVEQVEVLRGPQGTRFGANALAGMINIESQAPAEFTEGYVSAKSGNYNTRALGAAVSGAATEKLRLRLAAQKFVSDGYMENAYLERDDTNNLDEALVRLKAELDLDEANQLAFTLLHLNVENGYDAFSLDNTRTTYSDNPGQDEQKTNAASVIWTSEMADAFDLRVQASGSSTNSDYGYDEDWAYGEYDGSTGTCVEPGTCLANQEGAGGYSTTDQYLRNYDRRELDVRLTSSEAGRIFGDRSDWVVGVYGMKRDEDLLRYFYNWNTYADDTFTSELSTDSLALYGELATALSDDLTLTTGLRAERWSTDYADSNSIESDRSEQLWGGKLTLDYLLSNDSLAYASIARGYKAGGVNTDPDIDESNRTFDTEFNNAFEAGLKSSLLNDALQARIAAFYIQRKDQQVKSSYAIAQEGGGYDFQDYLANAAKGQSYGLELESEWALTDRLDWQLSAGWLRTEFLDYQYETDDGQFSMNGRDQAQSPEYTLANRLSYSLGSAWMLTLENEAKDSYYYSDSHDLKSDAFVLWHARVSYEVSDWQLAFYGRNLTDEEYGVRGFYGFDNDPRDGMVWSGATDSYVQLGSPRLLGLEGKYQF